MILYFSATGNTKYLADKLAKDLNDESINLLKRIKEKDYSPIKSDKPFIVCSPIYVCETPKFFNDYLKNVPLEGNNKIYFIFSSGGYAGIASKICKRIAKKKKMQYMGRKEFRMPRNYVASNMYPLLPENEILDRLNVATKLVHETAIKISNNEFLKDRHVWLFESIVTIPFVPIWSKLKHKTKKFYTTDSCIGCKKCANLCPLNNIEIVDGKPKWITNCSHCMACISNCPKSAIEYRNITENKEKYTISKYIDKIDEKL
ncbi:MAG: EFR1 family ferrodoxin [Acholeplasmatales bacterium]|nr:EFR1 family ferrodoxin [Acholeplasmatales bacterium]